jgi:hypothetical protein
MYWTHRTRWLAFTYIRLLVSATHPFVRLLCRVESAGWCRLRDSRGRHLTRRQSYASTDVNADALHYTYRNRWFTCTYIRLLVFAAHPLVRFLCRVESSSIWRLCVDKAIFKRSAPVSPRNDFGSERHRNVLTRLSTGLPLLSGLGFRSTGSSVFRALVSGPGCAGRVPHECKGGEICIRHRSSDISAVMVAVYDERDGKVGGAGRRRYCGKD